MKRGILEEKNAGNRSGYSAVCDGGVPEQRFWSLFADDSGACVAGRKKDEERALALTAVVFTAYFGVQAGLNAALQPESTNAMEGFTVPIQQLARTWNYSPEIFSQEDREALFEILAGGITRAV